MDTSEYKGGERIVPFKSKKQELWMRINKPALYKEWVEKYGHYKGKRKKKKKNKGGRK
jgi:hypothetical protein